MSDKTICELQKNAKTIIRFRLGELKGHKFIDMRLFVSDDGQEPTPTKRGLAIAPHLWPQFRRALAQVDQVLCEQRWLDREDLEYPSCGQPEAGRK
uniref:Transcriptional coactivator p15 (PC4) C-terminal domain-containing protein n=1 Tax=Desulfobacca acetoxidans TaxID=60893 RepID=A0A7V4LDE3_9BACT